MKSLSYDAWGRLTGESTTVGDGTDYVYKGALVFERNAAGKLFLDAANRWRYSGKEEQSAALNPALSLIDYGARMYDPTIARWMSVDPLAEKYYPMGGYGYCAGSPVYLVDPDGRMVGDYYNLSGNYIGTDGIEDGKKYLVLDNKEARVIKRINNAKGNTPISEVKSAISVPSSGVIRTADQAINNSKTNEHGFVVATDGTTSSIISGTEQSVQLGPAYIELEEQGKNTSFDVHTHPFTYSVENGEARYSNSEPSIPDDINYRKIKENNQEVNQASWILGESPLSFPSTGSPDTILNITFYNSSGTILTTSWDGFKRIVEKVNDTSR